MSEEQCESSAKYSGHNEKGIVCGSMSVTTLEGYASPPLIKDEFERLQLRPYFDGLKMSGEEDFIMNMAQDESKYIMGLSNNVFTNKAVHEASLKLEYEPPFLKHVYDGPPLEIEPEPPPNVYIYHDKHDECKHDECIYYGEKKVLVNGETMIKFLISIEFIENDETIIKQEDVIEEVISVLTVTNLCDGSSHFEQKGSDNFRSKLSGDVIFQSWDEDESPIMGWKLRVPV
jgi:hypothetical protein